METPANYIFPSTFFERATITGLTGTIGVNCIAKLYAKDRLILVKPKQLRYWLLSIALRDADETFNDYIQARYYHAER